MKQPGQVAYEACCAGMGAWERENEDTKYGWERAEAAVLAAYKPERPAGVWVTGKLSGNRSFIIPTRCVSEVLERRKGDWYICIGTGDAGHSVSEADARKIVESLGGTFPEESCKTNSK